MAEKETSEENISVDPVPSACAPAASSTVKSKTPKFVCVDYPGVVKNVEKAIDTLGGLNKLSHDHFKTAALELNYHRDNIYSRPAYSRRHNGTYLLVKARRRKPVSTGETGEIQEESIGKDEEVEAEVMGVVSTIHRFNAMFDFQYLPVARTYTPSDPPEYEDLLQKLVPSNLESAMDWLSDVGNDQPSTSTSHTDLFLPPFAFSRFTGPTCNVLGRETQSSNPTKDAVESLSGAPVVGLSLRKDRRLACLIIGGNEPFPEGPLPSAVEMADERISIPAPHDLMRAIFEERPIWTRSAVMVKSELEDTMLKFLLPKYAFYITSGPFGRLWCRFGYDPRTDRSNVVYQSIMINVSKTSGLASGNRARIGYKSQSTIRLKITSRGISSGRELRMSKPENHWYKFEPGVLPPFRQVFYQVKDIQLPEVQEEVDKALSTPDPVFHETNGWLLPGSGDRIRDAMKQSLRDTFEKLDLTEGPEGNVSDQESQDDEEDDDTTAYFGSPIRGQVGTVRE